MHDLNYQESVLRLLTSVKTLSLSVNRHDQSGHGVVQTELSLLPFIYYKGVIWVFVSQLSPHTQSLLCDQRASILIYPNETPAKNYFAIERISANCDVFEEHEKKHIVLELMTKTFGETVSLLRQLSDFHLLGLKPTKGRYIAGFGQAYDVDFSSFDFQHVKPKKVISIMPKE